MIDEQGPRYRPPELRAAPWRDRLRHLALPEHLAALALIAVASLLSGDSDEERLTALAFLLMPAVLAALSGSTPTAITAAAIFVGLTGSFAADDDAQIWVYVVIGSAAVALLELLRLGAARRRDAEIDPAIAARLAVIHLGSLAVLVGFVTVLDRVTEARDPDWDVVPVAFSAFVGLLALVAWAAGRHEASADKHRWQPGRRLVSPPRPGYEPRRRR